MAETTLAAVLHDLNQPLRVAELVIPPLRPGQVLVKVAYSGVCQSQLNEIRGRKGADRYLPHTLGHEGSGTVIGVGAGVTKVSPGMAVVLSWIKGLGAEVSGTLYQSADGPVNSGAISTFMQCTVTSENRVTPLPNGMPLREGALLGCAIPTGAGIVFNSSKIQKGESIVIFGAGGVGLSALIAARVSGAQPLIVVDIVPEKLAKAQSLGATHVIDSRTADPVATVRALTGGIGAQYAIEASGSPLAMESAFEAVRPGGGLCVIAGNAKSGATIRLNPFSLIAGKRIVGTWGGESQPDEDIPRYAAMFISGRLPLSELITAEYSLSDINKAFDDLEEGRVARALVVM